MPVRNSRRASRESTTSQRHESLLSMERSGKPAFFVEATASQLNFPGSRDMYSRSCFISQKSGFRRWIVWINLPEPNSSVIC
jgi:hypothetical protein